MGAVEVEGGEGVGGEGVVVRGKEGGGVNWGWVAAAASTCLL